MTSFSQIMYHWYSCVQCPFFFSPQCVNMRILEPDGFKTNKGVTLNNSQCVSSLRAVVSNPGLEGTLSCTCECFPFSSASTLTLEGLVNSWIGVWVGEILKCAGQGCALGTTALRDEVLVVNSCYIHLCLLLCYFCNMGVTVPRQAHLKPH